MDSAELQTRITITETRLSNYLAKEQEMLLGVQSYGIGSRNLARYNLNLETIRKMIQTLQRELDALNGQLDGIKPRLAQAIIPVDY